jgi:pantoate--beta-alanine ligase
MNIVTKIEDWQAIRKQLIGKTIGLIPTMGNLHAGHLSLCQRSQAENDITVISVVVNPTQFNQPEDFKLYPRTLEADKISLAAYDIDFLLCPNPADIYPDNYEVQVSEIELSRELEGAYRPGHFSGMLTIVLKLLNLVQPTRAYFGEKDYQQLLLVKKMVSALLLPIDIVGCETVRANDELALSSRNNRLNPQQREKAANFPRLLQSSLSTEAISEQLISLGFNVDYITEKWQRRLGAVWLDEIRLIDNIPIK